jgi:ArsR family transcriptional regulator, virulence genes transcriptional regulator
MVNFDPDSQQVFELQASILGVLANAKRLMIMKLLSEGARPVGEIAATLNMTLQNTSQHLRVMKDQGIVSSQREGQTVSYSLTNPVFSQCCELVRRALTEEMHKKGQNLARVEDSQSNPRSPTG